jgi:hypothetical protein
MRAVLIAVAVLLLAPAAAPAKTLDLPDLFATVLPQVKAKTYRIQAHAGTAKQEQRRLVRMANSAIRHGAR